MCDPVIAPIAVGVATAGLGAMQSIAGYQQKQTQYQYQKQSAIYKQQVEQANAVANYNRQMAAYAESQKAYEAQIEANEAAANRAYQYEQLKLGAEYRQASDKARQKLEEKLQAQGDVWAMGKTGNSWKVLASAAEREYGRDLARLGRNLAYRDDEYMLETHRIMLDQKSANNAAAAKRMVKPIMGYVEEAYVGPAPSSTEMVLGIGQSILSGVGTGMALHTTMGGTFGQASSEASKAAQALADNPVTSTANNFGMTAGQSYTFDLGKAGYGTNAGPLTSLSDAKIGGSTNYFTGFGK